MSLERTNQAPRQGMLKPTASQEPSTETFYSQSQSGPQLGNSETTSQRLCSIQATQLVSVTSLELACPTRSITHISVLES